MGLPFRQLRKLWLLYLFLLFFAFFMFALSINVYLQSIQASDLRKREAAAANVKRVRSTTTSVVVAHYIGAGNIFGNMTKDDYNVNQFQPEALEGAMGRPVIIPAKDSFKMQRLFKIHSFNILASDKIPLNRTLKDYRMDKCKAIEYNVHELPTTSVIIVFHNEAWSVLLRTIWSVIGRSPASLLKEIILIDDASDREYLQKPLEKYLTDDLPVRTKLFRLGVRQGLVPARLLGAANAEGDVLTFLDAHCECSPGWLEPLLARIKENRKCVVCPVIDIISDDNFGYTKTFENHWGAFNWHLSFRWYASNLDDEDVDAAHPIPTPGMAGGLFSIDKAYFYDTGGYDEAMKIWGGENVEMSFRIWQCGGSVEISPCSHVGHVFRKTTPYTFPGGVSQVLSNNLARAAMVWMDKWQDFFFMYSSVDMALKSSLNITDRVALRKRLNCKSFEWYLHNVWPDHFFPADDRFFGKIIWLNGKTELAKRYEKVVKSIPGRLVPRTMPRVFVELQKHSDLTSLLDLKKDTCLRNVKAPKAFASSVLSPLKVGNCLPDSNLQDMFIIRPNGQIMTNENVCLDYNKLKQQHQKGHQLEQQQLEQVQQQQRQSEAGTITSADSHISSDNTLKVVPPPLAVFLSRLEYGTKSSDIINYISSKGIDINAIRCRSLTPENLTGRISASFKILAPLSSGRKLLDPHFWPDNILVKEFTNKPISGASTSKNLKKSASTTRIVELPKQTNVQLFGCTDDPRQHWDYHIDTQQIVHRKSNMCLTIKSPDEPNRLVIAKKCEPGMTTQKWGLVPLPWKA